MLAAQILREAVDDISSDLRGPVVCLAPTRAGLAVLFPVTFVVLARQAAGGSSPTELAMPSGGEIVTMLASGLVLGLGWPWTAGAWHRMIVLGETPRRFFPPWHGGNVLGCLGRGLLVGLVSVPLAAVASRVAPNTAETATDGDPTT